MRLVLLRGYSNNEPKVVLGTLEYDGEDYIWTYSNAKAENPGLWEGFYEVPGIEMSENPVKSQDLFWYFRDRIPSKNRRNLPGYLEMFGLKEREYTEWEFIVASGLRTATDFDELVCEEELGNVSCNRYNKM